MSQPGSTNHITGWLECVLQEWDNCTLPSRHTFHCLHPTEYAA